MAKYRKGILHKKVFNEDGTIKERTPLFLKTLAKLVMTDSGKSVETRIEELDKKKSYLTYNSKEEYLADWENADKKAELQDILIVIMDD